ncbi:MAG: CehA/McbA family metallohydrolase [Pirellulales bacterium]|nr:CehA/McbA family metallohydrolase [Pirellulales bacterium]
MPSSAGQSVLGQRLIVASLSILLFASSLASAHDPPVRRAPRRPAALSTKKLTARTAPVCALELELVDRATGEPLPGIVQVLDAAGEVVPIAELVNRGQGIEDEGAIHRWHVLPHKSTIQVPAGPLVIKALAGLETELADERLDLTGRKQASHTVKLTRFARARRDGQVAGNTHLHLMKLSKEQADRYLREVPLADGLDIVFLSYLERAEADLEYTSNKYSPADLEKMSDDHVRFGHGEEHRHNFGSHGEGYGHLLLLDIPYIVRPVSIGPGIMREGNDAPPMQAGIDEARRAGGKVIWAHNHFGYEDIPNWITGRVHANNIFDGSRRGSYKDTYYRYLNIGLRVPFSTGTDWFVYDFSRVYVAADRPITPTEWLDRLAAGRTYITNEPLLEFTVDGQPIGGTIELQQPRAVKVRGRAIGRGDFKRIELVHNGRAVRAAPSRREENHFVVEMDFELPIDGPSWLALRTPPPPVENDPELQEPVGENEFGGQLFAHTSPVYVQFAGADVFDRDVARGLIDEMRADLKEIERQAHFADEAQRIGVRRVYDEAIAVLEKRLGS